MARYGPKNIKLVILPKISNFTVTFKGLNYQKLVISP